MNILIIYCHPSPKSYTAQVLEQLKSELLQRKWSVDISDLYALNFQSDMTATEYDREGFSNIELPISADVLKEHEKINKADCIIFLYPVWWSDCPAKLKGWFDRVLSVGYAYKQNENFPRMNTVKYGVALCTAGYTNDYLATIGIAQSMHTVMLDDRFGNRFKHKEMVTLGGSLELDNVRQMHRTQLTELVSRIATAANG